MSNWLSIATILGALKARLDTVLQVDPLGLSVTLSDPAETATPAVYLKLLRVTRNPTLTGAALPTRDGQGRLRERPLVPLTLHLAFAFTGSDMAPERLAGLVMAELVARPWLGADEIREYIASLSAAHPLEDSDLADAPERVRLTLTELSLDDQSKLWGMFGRSYAALTVTYEATPVLLEARESGGPAAPVISRSFTMLHSPPTLSALEPAGVATPGDALTLRGANLGAEAVRVDIGEVRVEPDDAANERVVFTLPASVRPGAHLVSVVHLDDVGELIVASQPLSLVVAPELGAASLDRSTDTVTLTGVTLPGDTEIAELYLAGETTSLASTDWTIAGSALEFRFAEAIPTGTFVVRLRIAGVFNRPTIESDAPGPRVS